MNEQSMPGTPEEPACLDGEATPWQHGWESGWKAGAASSAKDAERLDWLNDNGTRFAMTMRETNAFELEWIGDRGARVITKGRDIRACIDAALDARATGEAP